MIGAPRHALSFDVEEFFQVANLKEAFPKEDWDSVPSRIDLAMDRLLELLERRGARATMFFLGWVAVRRPDLVRRCHEAGHEIASHGWEHEFLWDLEGREGVPGALVPDGGRHRGRGGPPARGVPRLDVHADQEDLVGLRRAAERATSTIPAYTPSGTPPTASPTSSPGYPP